MATAVEQLNVQLHWGDFVVIALYFAAVIGVGIWASIWCYTFSVSFSKALLLTHGNLCRHANISLLDKLDKIKSYMYVFCGECTWKLKLYLCFSPPAETEGVHKATSWLAEVCIGYQWVITWESLPSISPVLHKKSSSALISDIVESVVGFVAGKELVLCNFAAKC